MSYSTKVLATYLNLRSFLNSFIRDYSLDKRVAICDSFLSIDGEFGKLKIQIKKSSMVGFYEFSNLFKLNDQKILVDELLDLILMEFSLDRKALYEKVNKSSHNISKNLSVNNFSKNKYLKSEQKLLLGHPYHPYPKSKKGMTVEDQVKYCPEFGNSFKLLWVEVNETDLFTRGLPSDYKAFIEPLIEAENLSKEKVLVPMHPWQWRKISKEVKALKVSEGNINFFALSSMRSVYSKNSPLQLKFSMDIELTNSVRHLTIDECLRSRRICDFIYENISIPKNLSILKEPDFVAFKDRNGQILKRSIVQFRENKEFENTFLLASLCEKVNKESKLREIALEFSENKLLALKTFFEHFLENIIYPFIELQNQGVLLGAHLQNILVEFNDGLPQGVVYRDCQGSGFTQDLAFKFCEKYDFEEKTVLSNENVDKVFGYYLIINTLFTTIAALSSDKEDEYRLLTIFRNHLYDWIYQQPENQFLKYICHSKYLWSKGNSYCVFNLIDENTSETPWMIYKKVLNPLSKLRAVEHLKSEIVFKCKDKKGRNFSYRRINLDDLDLFHSWHHLDHVKEFWELNISKSELKKYIEKTLNSPFKLPFIFELDGKPVGYYEVYWAYEDRIAPYGDAEKYDRGLHLLIGEKKYLKTRVVYDSMLFVSQYLLENHPKTLRVLGEPRADNKNILKFCEALPGWKFIKEFDFPHKRAALLECHKDRFYLEKENAI